MHLLYLDDAGSAPNPNETHLVLGGVSVAEQQVHHLTEQLDALATSIHPAEPHQVEFHASEIFARRTVSWKGMERAEAQGVILAVLKVLTQAYDTATAFACAVHKASFPNEDPMEVAFEEICNRFDLYLRRLQEQGERQRGLLIIDKSAHETTLQRMARDFRTTGTRWGSIRNIAEVPLFVDSRASRLVQLADHVAYATFRLYNADDYKYLKPFHGRFDEADNVVHGLVHKIDKRHQCMCVACFSRRPSAR